MLVSLLDRLLALKRPETVAVDGRPYSTSPLLSPVAAPVPDALKVSTLTGLIDYLESNRDELDKTGTIIHVVSPTRVSILSVLIGPFEQRATYMTAMYEPPAFGYGQFMKLDEFIVQMLSKSVDSGDRAALLKVLGSVTGSAVKTMEDDGVTQVVTAKTGVARVGEIAINNPVALAPFRTFPEVEQPLSNFVYRLKDAGDGCFAGALFEADGGAWKAAAVSNVVAWLRDKLPAGFVVIS